MFMRTAATFAAVVATSSILSTAAFAQQDETAAHGQVDLGKTTFAQKCSHCHGPNMVNSGTVTPDLRRFPDDQPATLRDHREARQERPHAAMG